MKVIAINGSPKENGNTAQALSIISKELLLQGINLEVINVGKNSIRGCIGCNKCFVKKNNRCIFNDDIVNSVIEKFIAADGIILASPTHWAGVSGTIKSLLDRVFYVSSANGGLFRQKAGASLAVVRRTGGLEAVDQLNKYLFYSEMIIASSNYWNVIHGRVPGEVLGDGEGVQILEVLAKNLAYILKLKDFAKEHVTAPERVVKEMTNFVR